MKVQIGDLVRLDTTLVPVHNAKGEVIYHKSKCSPFSEFIVANDHFINHTDLIVEIIKTKNELI